MANIAKKAAEELFRWGSVIARVALYPLVAGSQVRRQTFRFAAEALRHQLPMITLSKVVNGALTDEDDISLQAVPEHTHNCTIFELFTLATLARTVNPLLCLEIGTYDGRSALAIATNCRPEARVVTMNLPPEYVSEHPEQVEVVDVQLSAKVKSGNRWAGRKEAGKIEQIFANSLEFDFGSIGQPQFIFIDGAHDQRAVESDTKKTLQILDRKNGMMVWHDARDYGVRPVLKDLYDRGFPVYIVEHTNMALLWFRNGQPAKLI